MIDNFINKEDFESLIAQIEQKNNNCPCLHCTKYWIAASAMFPTIDLEIRKANQAKNICGAIPTCQENLYCYNNVVYCEYQDYSLNVAWYYEKADDYNEYLKTKHWKAIKDYFKNGIIDSCEICHSKNNLEIHHIKYDLFREDLGDLRVLCRDCHSRITIIQQNIPETDLKIKKIEADFIAALKESKDVQSIYDKYNNEMADIIKNEYLCFNKKGNIAKLVKILQKTLNIKPASICLKDYYLSVNQKHYIHQLAAMKIGKKKATC